MITITITSQDSCSYDESSVFYKCLNNKLLATCCEVESDMIRRTVALKTLSA